MLCIVRVVLGPLLTVTGTAMEAVRGFPIPSAPERVYCNEKLPVVLVPRAFIRCWAESVTVRCTVPVVPPGMESERDSGVLVSVPHRGYVLSSSRDVIDTIPVPIAWMERVRSMDVSWEEKERDEG